MSMKEKTINKRRSIGLASKEVGVDDHVIRFWGKEFPQIKPNVGKGGRRYYYDEDIETILKIKYFLYDAGYTIKGLQNLLNNNKRLLKKSLEDIKNMSKIIDLADINNDNLTFGLNNLIEIRDKLENLVSRFNNFNFE